MNIKIFQVEDENQQEKMDKELKQYKLENVLSLWYFVVSAHGQFIVGSKG